MPPVPRPKVDESSPVATAPKALSNFQFGVKPSSGEHSITKGNKHYDYPTQAKYDLQRGQVRALSLLLRARRDGALYSRQRIKTELGISPLSGTLGTWFEGVGEGTKRGRGRKGLFEHGFVVEDSVDVEGLKEVVLCLTDEGAEVAIQLEKEQVGKPLPPLRDKYNSTNKRYLVD